MSTGIATVGGGFQNTQGGGEVVFFGQADPSALTVTAGLTTDQLIPQRLVADAGTGAEVTYTLPSVTDMNSEFGNLFVGSAFKIVFTNISTNVLEIATIAVPTGWTAIGNVTVAANSSTTTVSWGVFEVRKTSSVTYSLTRVG